MPITEDVKKAITDPTPLYAYVGATDLAIEKIREAGSRAGESAERGAHDVADLPKRARRAAKKVRDELEQAPTTLRDAARWAAESAAETYEDLATRGEKLVDRIKNQDSTQELLDQVDSTRAQAKGTATSARRSVAAVEDSAQATLQTAADESKRAAAAIADATTEKAETAGAEVKRSARRTRTAAKKTAATTRKRATAPTRAAKATATSARKSAAKAATAATEAAEKVGD